MKTKVIATNTESYPNLILETLFNGRYVLRPAEGYVIHDHAGCVHEDAENGIEGFCMYSRAVYLAATTDISTINDVYKAVLESTVPADSIH